MTATTTKKIVLNWGGVMYDEEIEQETGVPGLCWAIDAFDSVEYWEGGNRLDGGEVVPGPTRHTTPCFTCLDHAIGYFLGTLPPEWRAAKLVLPDDVQNAVDRIKAGGAENLPE